jgi:tetratricopeptide (TPR) repeat protein
MCPEEGLPLTTPWKPGDRIENRWDLYRIMRGGLGIVYVFWDDVWREAFAAKTFQDEVFARDPGAAGSFVREARCWLNLDAHQNVVRARFVETIHGKPFLFLEYVSGGDLSAWIGTPRLTQDLPLVLRLAIQFCDGMSHASSKGIQVHRDIKPQNCLVTKDLELKVTDFGLAKVLDDASLEETQDTGSPERLSIYKSSLSGNAAGTCTHMAPEQFDDAKHVDVRADVYSFGVMLFQMVQGKLPFQGRTWRDMANLHRNAPPPSLDSGLPPLDSIAHKCLAKRPADRFADFAMLRQELASIYENTFKLSAPQPAAGRALEAYEMNNKGHSLENLGRTQEALACFDRAIAMDPTLAQAWSNKGSTLAGLGRNEEALRCIDRALEIDPRYAPGWFSRGVALDNLRRPEESLACYDRGLDITVDPDALYNKGLVLRGLDRLEEALACFDRVIAIKPDEANAWSHRGILLGRLGRFDERLTCFERAVTLDPDNAQHWAYKGVALARMGRPQEALSSVNRAVALKPQDPEIWSQKGNVLNALGRNEEAVSSFDRALALNPLDAAAWDSKGIALGSLQRAREAAACFDQAVRIEPGLAVAWYHKGIALLHGCQNATEGLAAFEEAHRLGHPKAGEKVAEYRKSLAKWNQMNEQIEQLFRQGQFDAAAPLARAALRVAEMEFAADHLNTATALNILAAVYYRQGRPDDCEPLYRRALAIREEVLGPEHPDVAALLVNLATLYDAQGKSAEAETLYNRAVGVREKAFGSDHPEVSAALADLASFYERHGRHAEAAPLAARAAAIRDKTPR